MEVGKGQTAADKGDMAFPDKDALPALCRDRRHCDFIMARLEWDGGGSSEVCLHLLPFPIAVLPLKGDILQILLLWTSQIANANDGQRANAMGYPHNPRSL